MRRINQGINERREGTDVIKAEEAVRTLLALVDPDPTREGLRDTPQRVIRSWIEMTNGSLIDPKAILQRDFEMDGYDQMVVCRDIEFTSLCEHHVLPFVGSAHIGYIPNGRVVGLSKLPRIVDAFAARLQIQERLTHQIASTIEEVLRPKGTAVVLVAAHQCMRCRGVKKASASMVTAAMHGVFSLNGPARAEFLAYCHV